MFGNPRYLLDQETIKPTRPTVTLARFARYFKPFWPALLLVAILVVVSTWMQVTTPDITGQLVDCYLTPTAAAVSGGDTGGLNFTGSSQSNCWLATRTHRDHPHNRQERCSPWVVSRLLQPIPLK